MSALSARRVVLLFCAGAERVLRYVEVDYTQKAPHWADDAVVEAKRLSGIFHSFVGVELWKKWALSPGAASVWEVLSVLCPILVILEGLLVLSVTGRQLHQRWWRSAEMKAVSEKCSIHAGCQTIECDLLCSRCDAKSCEVDKMKGELLTEQSKCSDFQKEAQEARSQLTAARERLVELGSEAREQKLQNDVQVKRLERALKEWNASETERRRAECSVRVLEQELERLRKELSQTMLPEALPAALPATPPRPMPKRVTLDGAVLDKARRLEERMQEERPKNEAPQEKNPRSPNAQMREKMAEARRRLERNLPEAESATEPTKSCSDDQAKVSTGSRSPSHSTASVSSPRPSEK